MGRKRKHSDDQIIHKLREAEIALSQGRTVKDVCRQLEVTEQTYYRWKKQFGDLGTAEVRELRQLREENRKLKQLVADLSLDKTILREALGKKF